MHAAGAAAAAAVGPGAAAGPRAVALQVWMIAKMAWSDAAYFFSRLSTTSAEPPARTPIVPASAEIRWAFSPPRCAPCARTQAT
ncbi:MAG: hypothetical protein IPF92_28005 [Myxococcales bacterium]|nr:hypothetical protein [Myxococcales bacterium]